MNHSSIKALSIVLASMGLALIFNFLFFSKLIGISILIFTIIFLSVVYMFRWYWQLPFKQTRWLVLPILFFATMPSIRANEILTFLNLCATFSLLMLLARELINTPVFLMKLYDYFTLIFFTPLQMLRKAFSTIFLASQIHSEVKSYNTWLRVFKGIIMALPALIIFGSLFSQADPVFSQFIKKFLDINISEKTAQYTALLIFAFTASLSFLSYTLLTRQTKQASSNNEQFGTTTKQSGSLETLVSLGLISFLFFIFICFQVNYLFGGETNITNNTGFTYAEYARRGFWELLAVVALSLLTLLASEKYAGAELKKDKKFLIPSLVLIAEVFIIIFSTIKRLSLYVDAYGLTESRFYAAGFIMLLSLLFILLAIKFIKLKPEHFFAFGTLLSIITFLATVNILNPDAFVAQSNLKKYNQTENLDITYLGKLSPDAASQKIKLYEKLEGEDKNILRELLQKQKEKLQKDNINWQSTNLSRAKALKLYELSL